jgi:hypothetical protein
MISGDSSLVTGAWFRRHEFGVLLLPPVPIDDSSSHSDDHLSNPPCRIIESITELFLHVHRSKYPCFQRFNRFFFSFTDAGSRRHTTHDAITLCNHARKVVNMIVFTPVSARVERLTTFHASASIPNNTCWVPTSRQEHWNLIGTNTPGLRPVDSRHFDDRHPVLRMRTPCLVASAVLGRFALSALHV